MDEKWRYDRFKLVLVMMFIYYLNFSLCCSLNREGAALLRFREGVAVDPFAALKSWNCNGGSELDHCSWFGVECADGEVVILNLKDLCLEGTLGPELGTLTRLKSINLRNNSFRGNIPREILELKELETLDLGYNNLSGSLPSNLGNNLSLSILLLDNNEFLSISGELNELEMLSEFQVDENQLTGSAFGAHCNTRYDSKQEAMPQRGLLQISNNDRGSSAAASPSPSGAPTSSMSFPPSSSPSSPTESPSFSPSPSPVPSPIPSNQPTNNSQSPQTRPVSTASNNSSRSESHTAIICSAVVGGSLFVFISALGLFYWRRKKTVIISPWATGLSGQLKKAFITGVPKLQRSELVTACEDFSNIIGNISDGIVYKGTLSSGVEIAVTSTVVKSASDWTKNLEAQFRHKIDTLSKVNHKNFVNLIGFCEEEKPFTRMMVFEYAPNGTLFEHLHIKESEHLDWRMRLRIAMGMAYCLEYMHQLNPPISHANLQSSSVYLTEDYAAKLSDFTFWNESRPSKMDSFDTLPSDPETNVYSFGVILFEMITGRIPYSVGDGSRVDWASDYLNGDRVKSMVDSTLIFCDQEEVRKLFEVVKGCVYSDPKRRMKMRDVVMKLKEITDMGPDGATPKVSPLWWAELEILSTES